jgi:hypothetical protein
MKKFTLLAGILAIAIVSCKKSNDEDSSSGNNNPPPIVIPTSFTQKVLLEEFTGAWCGYCTRGAAESDKIDTLQDGKFIAVAVHVSDVMEIAHGNSLDSLWNDYGYPGGMINRIKNGTSATLATNYWASKTSAIVSQAGTAGLAINASDVSGETLTLKVSGSINSTVTGPYKLNVYLVESSVINVNSTYNQQNYLSSTGSAPDPNSPYYSYPPIIPSFNHKHVLRARITTGLFGEDIPVDKVGAGIEFSSTYTVNLTGYDHTKMRIVAFIDTYSTDKLAHKILNVQETSVGTNKNYD